MSTSTGHPQHPAGRAAPGGRPTHGGRPLDESRDAELMDATLELLAEQGYDRLTMEAVAARAQAGKATIYRRWPSKVDLVVDAVGRCQLQPQDVPDTGSLRGDLATVFLAKLANVDASQIDLMTGLITALRRNPDLAAAFQQKFLAPRLAMLRQIFVRARERGEVADGCDIDLLAEIAPGIVFHRLLLVSKPISKRYILRIVDEIILPLAAHGPSGKAPAPSSGKAQAPSSGKAQQ